MHQYQYHRDQYQHHSDPSCISISITVIPHAASTSISDPSCIGISITVILYASSTSITVIPRASVSISQWSSWQWFCIHPVSVSQCNSSPS